MQFKFQHLHFICSDLKASEHFFVDVLGARLVEYTTFGPADGTKLDLGGTAVWLRTAVDGEKIGPRKVGAKTFGYDHFGVTVDDLDAVHRELSAKGVVFTVAPRKAGKAALAFIQGPDNITVELFQMAS